MYIHIRLSYDGPAWEALRNDRQWAKLEVVQNISLKMITGLPWFVRNTVIRRYTGKNCIKKQLIISASHNMFHKNIISNHSHLKILDLDLATVEWIWTLPARLLEQP